MYNQVAPAPYYMTQGQPAPAGYYMPGQPVQVMAQPAVVAVQQQPNVVVVQGGNNGNNNNNNRSPQQMRPGPQVVRNAGHNNKATENKTISDIRSISSSAEAINKNTQETNFYIDLNNRRVLISTLNDMNSKLEDLTIKMSVSARSLLADAEFRGELLVMANKLQRALQSVKELQSYQEPAGCCGVAKPTQNYIGDVQLSKVCESLASKVSSFKGSEAFKLDLNTTGTVAMTGDTTVNYNAEGMAMSEDNIDQVMTNQMVEEGTYYN